VNFGDFNLNKGKELLGALGGEGKELNAQTLLNLLKRMVEEPEKGKELVEKVSSETEGGGNLLKVITKLYGYAKKFGII